MEELSSNELTGIFKQIEEHSYSENTCFLCGCLLNEKNKTDEHVIPKWILHEFNLWNEKITLLNGTLLSYRFLTIPCCSNCNNNHLSPFEHKIKEAYLAGFNEFKKLDREILFLWLGKIFFGILYKELFLNADRKSPSKGNITTPELLKSFYTHLLFLQGIRNKIKYLNFFPASIFLFKTQKPKKAESQWDLKDNPAFLFISIRMGEIGVFAALQDVGATQQMEDLLEHHKDIDLHPLQFNEMAAKILYKVSLMNTTPRFVNVQNNDFVNSHLLPLQRLDGGDIYNDWNNDDYSILLSKYTELPLETCQPVKGKVNTWLNDENGNSTFIKLEE